METLNSILNLTYWCFFQLYVWSEPCLLLFPYFYDVTAEYTKGLWLLNFSLAELGLKVHYMAL